MGDSTEEVANTHSEGEAAVMADRSSDSTGDAVVDIDHVPAAQSDVPSSPKELPAPKLANQSDQSSTNHVSEHEEDNAGSPIRLWGEYDRRLNFIGRLKLFQSRQRGQVPHDIEWTPATFPYYRKVEEMRGFHPELNVIREFFLHAGRVPKTDVLHIFQIPRSGEAIFEEYDCVKEEHVNRLQAKIKTVDTSPPVALRLVIVPDLSPVTLEILGDTLKVDYQVFVNHLWSCTGQPFEFLNTHEYDVHTRLDQAPNTTTVDCDVNVMSYSDHKDLKKETLIRLLRLYRMLGGNNPNNLRPSLTEWPVSLACPPNTHMSSVQYHGTSRITIHHLQSSDSTPTGMLRLSSHLHIH